MEVARGKKATWRLGLIFGQEAGSRRKAQVVQRTTGIWLAEQSAQPLVGTGQLERGHFVRRLADMRWHPHHASLHTSLGEPNALPVKAASGVATVT